MDARADEIIRRQERMAGDRATWEHAFLISTKSPTFVKRAAPMLAKCAKEWDSTAALGIATYSQD
jgi:hypothetical protein